MLTDLVVNDILTAEAKALSTSGKHGINVVPISVIDINDGVIFLYDFFMHKTVDNLLNNPEVALCAWRGLVGVQIKGSAEYITNGKIYSEAEEKMKIKFPDRVLTGLIKITPSSVYDVSADVAKSGKRIS